MTEIEAFIVPGFVSWMRANISHKCHCKDIISECHLSAVLWLWLKGMNFYHLLKTSRKCATLHSLKDSSLYSGLTPLRKEKLLSDPCHTATIEEQELTKKFLNVHSTKFILCPVHTTSIMLSLISYYGYYHELTQFNEIELGYYYIRSDRTALLLCAYYTVITSSVLVIYK